MTELTRYDNWRLTPPEYFDPSMDCYGDCHGVRLAIEDGEFVEDLCERKRFCTCEDDAREAYEARE